MRSLEPQDPLNFQDTKSYKDRVKAHQEKTGRKDAMIIGEGMMNGRRVVLCVFDFSFMGGQHGVGRRGKDLPGDRSGIGGQAAGHFGHGLRRSPDAGGDSLADADGQDFCRCREAGRGQTPVYLIC